LKHQNPKACWLMPTFHNPLGATMPDDHKRALVEMLARHGVPLIEDDVYAELYFGEASPRPAKAWDREGLVLHCSSFSKSLSPGYRIGWVAPGRFLRDVARQKLTTTLMSSMPAQLGLVDYLRRAGFDRHLRKLRQTLAERHAEVAAAVFRYFPESSCATRPDGSYFLWVQMPEKVDAMVLLRRAVEHKICIAPGPVFSPSGAFGNCVRLNFSHGLAGRTHRALELLGAWACEASGRRPAQHS
jgi:DNA-binding transcriptional MocR family regulator